ALFHQPQVLFLDEPTIGLDVSMQLTVRNFIRAYNERSGATVLLTSHYMDDVAALCPRVVVIDKGRLRYDGSLAQLVTTMRPEKRIAVRLGAPVALDQLADLVAGGARVVEHGEAKLVLQLPQSALRETMTALLERLPIVDLTVEDPPLEEVMSELFSTAAPDAPDTPDTPVVDREPESGARS